MASRFLLAISLSTLGIGLVAAVVGLLCRRAPPSVRNLVWNAALLACAAGPIAWGLGPRLTVDVPTEWMSKVSRLVATTPAPADISVGRAWRQLTAIRPSGNGSATVAESASKTVFLIWLSGVLFFAARFGRQMLFARGLVRRATKIARGELDAILADAKATLAVRVDVNVRESSEIDIPIATGIARPTILLPAYSNEWDSSELRTVLLHELAHVKRADIWACSAAMIACGLNWFNPVVWLLSELATRDAELAADDLVLRSGVRPSSYADTLLSVVNNVSRYPHMQLAMPLARRGMLADRIHAILRESAVRSEIGSNIRSTVLIATLAVIVLVACVRVSAAPPKPVGSASPQSASHSETRVAVSIGSPAPVPRSQSAGPRPIPDRTDTSWVAGATEGLIAALNDQSPQVRGEAARSLGNLKARASREALSRLVNDPDKFVRYEALSALSALDRTR